MSNKTTTTGSAQGDTESVTKTTVVIDKNTRIPLGIVFSLIGVICAGVLLYAQLQYSMRQNFAVLDWRLSRIEKKLGIEDHPPMAMTEEPKGKKYE